MKYSIIKRHVFDESKVCIECGVDRDYMKGLCHATTERQIEESSIAEHQNRDGSRAPAKSGSSDSTE